MHTLPTAALEVIPPQLLLRLAKAGFDLPSSKRDPQKIANGPSPVARDAVADEVLHLIGANIRRDDQQ